MTALRAEVMVTGVVQGVGFRYFCYRLALDLGLVGWVGNCSDGSVQLVCEGEQSQIEDFLTQLKVGPRSAAIKGINYNRSASTGEFSAFEIR